MPSVRRHLALLGLLLTLGSALAGPALATRGEYRVYVVERAATPFVWPADGTVTSPFGTRGRGFHPGIDIGMLRSLAVHAAAAGDVTAVGYLTGYEGYGNTVLVDLGGGDLLLYAHLARASVHVGQRLAQGDPIGTAGCTGACSGTHLHFEMRHNGRAVDPAPLLP